MHLASTQGHDPVPVKKSKNTRVNAQTFSINIERLWHPVLSIISIKTTDQPVWEHVQCVNVCSANQPTKRKGPRRQVLLFLLLDSTILQVCVNETRHRPPLKHHVVPGPHECHPQPMSWWSMVKMRESNLYKTLSHLFLSQQVPVAHNHDKKVILPVNHLVFLESVSASAQLQKGQRGWRK